MANSGLLGVNVKLLLHSTLVFYKSVKVISNNKRVINDPLISYSTAD